MKIEWHTEKRKIKDLIPYEKNPRKITKEQEEQLTASLEKFNIAEIPAIDIDNKIIAGHQRLAILKKLGRGEEEIDIRIPNRKLTKEEFEEYNLRSNKNMGEWDLDILKNFENDFLKEVGFDSQELDKIFNDIEEDDFDADSEYQQIEEPKSKYGEVYELGRHRLMCGDSTKREDVEKLMDGKKADMVFTDPPYGINLNTDWSTAKSSLKFLRDKKVKGGKKHDKIINDDKPFEPKFIFDWFGYCKEIFLWGANYYAERILNKNKGSWFCWDKRLEESMDKMYGSCFELCWSKKKHKQDIIRIRWAGIFGREAEKEKQTLHPTRKPIALCKWFIEKFSKRNNIIIDLFGGSGSTLIACEQTDRICYMMELDSKYTDVIIARWEKFTGKKAKLL